MIAPQEKDRSKAQNRLYWMWLNQWAKKQERIKIMSIYSLRRTLAKIYDRDDVGQYKKTFKAVRELKDSKHPFIKMLQWTMRANEHDRRKYSSIH